MSQALSPFLSHYWRPLIKSLGTLSETEISSFTHLENAPFYQVLKNRFHFSEPDLLTKIACKIGAHYTTLSSLSIDTSFQEKFSSAWLHESHILPLYCEGTIAAIATDLPFNPSFQTKAFSEAFPEHLNIYFICSHELDGFWRKKDTSSEEDNILFQWLYQAIDKHASDIHFSAQKKGYHVHFRLDGTLYPSGEIKHAQHFVQLIKLHSHMDISIFNQSQDGALSITKGNKTFDFRVASLPTVYGEDFVCRQFDYNFAKKTIHQLGFSRPYEEHLKTILAEKNGLFLCTGPTGSGKTSTLYACLRELQAQNRGNIVTLEDPIESILPGIRQSHINQASGHTFAQGLKALLRQDPDIILIGEIRDKETAKIALEAAYTGHLVLSSLHTNNVKKTMLRLISFGLDPFLIRQSLKGVLAQSLVPARCPKKCSINTGCSHCNFSGYKSRMVLAECLRVKEGITPKGDILKNIDIFLSQNYFMPFSEDRASKVAQGLISSHVALS